MLTRWIPTAARIHANDTPKLIRAIEVCVAARRPMSANSRCRGMARDPLTGFRLLRIGLNPPRQQLYDRLNQRCAQMFASGPRRGDACPARTLRAVKALDSLGYRQARAVLDGTPDEESGNRKQRSRAIATTPSGR
jgi:tRNA dimethylallyltransferase